MLAVEADADDSSRFRRLLEDGDDVGSIAHHRADPGRTFGGEIADLDTTRAQHSDGLRVGRIVWFGQKFDRLTGRAEQDFETAITTALPIGMAGADDMEAELAGHDTRP